MSPVPIGFTDATSKVAAVRKGLEWMAAGGSGLQRGLKKHGSVLRNQLIAETFHRTGAIEAWGRGTNRVIEECQRWGIDPPTFEERCGSVVVTFQAPIGPDRPKNPQVTPQVTPQVVAILEAAQAASSRSGLQEAAGLKDREHFRLGYLEPLLDAGWLEMTIPDKPRSSKQRYRTTDTGRQVLREKTRE